MSGYIVCSSWFRCALSCVLWQSGQKLCTLVGHKSPINSTVYQGRGEENTFVTGASDGIKFWRLPVDMRPDHGTLTPSEEASEHIQVRNSCRVFLVH